MAKTERKPLSKRGTWVKFPRPGQETFILAGVGLTIKPWVTPNKWAVDAMGSCFVIEATSLRAAKKEALVEVQRRLKEAYEQWSD